MAVSPIISARGLTKVYRLFRSPVDRVKEALHPLGKRYHQEFYALRGVSFDIAKGETLGIIGRNGSGKSTLLKIIAGVLFPTQGVFRVSGLVTALLELGAGFNPELTGIENIFLSGTIMGHSRAHTQSLIDEIADFADIGDFMFQPVKNYSSGMQVRLAFAIATAVNPSVLIVDEALAVGDMTFQAKCARKMKELMHRECTTLFVSHDMHAVRSLCTNALYLREGKVAAFGPADLVCAQYESDVRSDDGTNVGSDGVAKRRYARVSLSDINEQKRAAFQARVSTFRAGSGGIRVQFAEMLGRRGESTQEICHGDPVSLRVFIETTVPCDEVILEACVRTKNQVEVLGTSVLKEAPNRHAFQIGSLYCVHVDFDNFLKAGEYNVRIVLKSGRSPYELFDLVENAIVFRANDLPQRTRWALYNPPIECQARVV